VVRNRIRAGFYLDSVALMRLSARIAALDGVQEAVLMIGTPSNLQIMRDAGLLAAQGESAGPNDLVMAVRADDAAAAEAALAQAEAGLDERGAAASAAPGAAPRPRSLDGAVEALPRSNLALISTPGPFAAREARAALARGLNVMIFSDNVPLPDEVALKREAAAQGLLLMGPDCGTAYIAGTPLAFANRVPDGDIGVIAASGTGLQEFAVLCSRMGRGIRHGIGVGGRDLSDEVGGISTLAALALLREDPGVRELVLIAKPPGRGTAERVFAALAGCGKPVTACVFGTGAAGLPAGIVHAATLKAAAEQVCGEILPVDASRPRTDAAMLSADLAPGRHLLRGLYSGGTLCTEAQVVLRSAGLATRSNAPLPGAGGQESAHSVLDLGADEYTAGRPHPMIEPAVRAPQLEQALADPEVAVVLLDVVLGLGAHPDPAAEVARCLHRAPRQRPCVIVSVCGTDADPQGHARQVACLHEAGAVVAPCNADAAALAAAVIRRLEK
jgi:FdrA protein